MTANIRAVPPLLAALLLAPATGSAQGARETVRCTLDDAPERACVYTDIADRAGRHRMTFVGRANSGWWTGLLNGKPAMGFERNRGHIVFSTTDLGTRFAWWYPSDAHGTY